MIQMAKFFDILPNGLCNIITVQTMNPMLKLHSKCGSALLASLVFPNQPYISSCSRKMIWIVGVSFYLI